MSDGPADEAELLKKAGALLRYARDEVRRAAEQLRLHAVTATPGPWCFYNGNLWTGRSADLAAYDAGPEGDFWPVHVDGSEIDHLFHGDPKRPEDASFIAVMDPDMALALALWLEDEAVGAQTETGEPTMHAVLVSRLINGAAADPKPVD